jgi:hypothetical protein
MIEQLTCESCGATIYPATLQAQRDQALAEVERLRAQIDGSMEQLRVQERLAVVEALTAPGLPPPALPVGTICERDGEAWVRVTALGRAESEQRVLDVVREMMRNSPNWVRENLPTLYEAAHSDELARGERERG